MSRLNEFCRPVSAAELAALFGLRVVQLRRILERSQIGPAAHIGKLRVYGPREVRRVSWALSDAVEARPVA